jgi:hypothetical protein
VTVRPVGPYPTTIARLSGSSVEDAPGWSHACDPSIDRIDGGEGQRVERDGDDGCRHNHVDSCGWHDSNVTAECDEDERELADLRE